MCTRHSLECHADIWDVQKGSQALHLFTGRWIIEQYANNDTEPEETPEKYSAGRAAPEPWQAVQLRWREWPWSSSECRWAFAKAELDRKESFFPGDTAGAKQGVRIESGCPKSTLRAAHPPDGALLRQTGQIRKGSVRQAWPFVFHPNKQPETNSGLVSEEQGFWL